MVNFALAAAFAIAALGVTAARAADTLSLLSLDDEILPEPRATAEAVFIGLVWPRSKGAEASTGTILAAIPPEMRKQEVCVRVTTEDGRYTGNARYRDNGVATSMMTILPYRPAKAGLRAYPDERVAVLAFSCGDADRLTDLAVASWRNDNTGFLGAEANLLINSFRANEAFILLNGSKEIDCVALEVGERAAYDFSCPLSISDIKGGAEVDLFRIRGTSMDPEVSMKIVGWE